MLLLPGVAAWLLSTPISDILLNTLDVVCPLALMLRPLGAGNATAGSEHLLVT